MLHVRNPHAYSTLPQRGVKLALALVFGNMGQTASEKAVFSVSLLQISSKLSISIPGPLLNIPMSNMADSFNALVKRYQAI